MTPTRTAAQLVSLLAQGRFRPMTEADYLGFAGATDTTRICEDDTVIVLFDPEAPTEGFEMYDYAERFADEPNMGKCWRVAMDNTSEELF
jgi:hypothetical protein